MSSARKPLWWIVAAAALAAVAGFLTQRYCCAPEPTAAPDAERPSLRATLTYPKPKPVPAFALQQADGNALTEAELRGHWTLVFFGFTRCPDACPTTLAMFKQLTERWAQHPAAARAANGVITIKTTERNGLAVGFLQVRDEDQIMIMAAKGKILRCRVDDIREIGRNTQGVRLLELDEPDDRVIGVARLAEGARHSANRAGLVVCGGVAPALAPLASAPWVLP